MQCDTKYPVMLVHGTGSRDRRFPQYWGRIPKKLRAEGAQVFFGGQDAWGSIETNAAMLSERLTEILAETGCEKVNIITHSKGGLDARYMISALGRAGQVSSLTTISAPHHGSKTMDLLMRMPHVLFRIAALPVNLLFRLFGDKKPDFYRACTQFTTDYMKAFNEQIPAADGVYYQSYATSMRGVRGDWLMAVPYLIIKAVEGENDGLVTPAAAQYGAFQGTLSGAGRRGISHLDTVDFRRRPLTRKGDGEGVRDITETYIGILKQLKANGH